MGAEPLPGETSKKTSCLRLCPQLAASCGVPGAGRALGLGDLGAPGEGAGKRERKASVRPAQTSFLGVLAAKLRCFSPPPPALPRLGDVISSMSLPSPAGREPQPGDIGGSSCRGDIATASPWLTGGLGQAQNPKTLSPFTPPTPDG